MAQRDDLHDVDGLERELHELAPEPGFEFLRRLERELGEPAPRRVRGRTPWLRRGLAGGLTASLAVGLAATGGLSYAATSLGSAAGVVQRVAKPNAPRLARGLSAGGDQYRPGFGFGDPNHNHEGPPGLSRQDPDGVSGSSELPAKPTRDALAKTVGASVTFDEQVHLYISVIDPRNRPLLLTQRSKRGGSTVGNGLDGPQTKFIQYAVLVPRTIPMELRVPSNLLSPSVRYRIRIVALDAQGNRTQLLIPFRA